MNPTWYTSKSMNSVMYITTNVAAIADGPAVLNPFRMLKKNNSAHAPSINSANGHDISSKLNPVLYSHNTSPSASISPTLTYTPLCMLTASKCFPSIISLSPMKNIKNRKKSNICVYL